MNAALIGHYEEDKYRWHDLRKNPNDLPKFAPEEYSRDYLCEFKTHYGEIFHEICSYQYFDSVEDFDWCGMGWRERESLIAWREIEPFEVEG